MKPLHDSAVLSTHVGSCLDTNAVISLLSIITSLPGDPAGGRRGGFLALYSTESQSMVVRSFGEFAEEKTGQYLRNACEKATRVIKRWELRSFDSKNEANEQYGGGVRVGGLAVAFSGLPEKLDEALSYVYMTHITHVVHENLPAFGITGRSFAKENFPDNEFIIPVLDLFAEQRLR